MERLACATCLQCDDTRRSKFLGPLLAGKVLHLVEELPHPMAVASRSRLLRVTRVGINFFQTVTDTLLGLSRHSWRSVFLFGPAYMVRLHPHSVWDALAQ